MLWMTPRVPEVTSAPGIPRICMLKTLNASARICRLLPSEIRKLFAVEKSTSIEKLVAQDVHTGVAKKRETHWEERLCR